MTDATARAVLMLNAARVWIKKYGRLDGTIKYDDAECDGFCLLDDLKYAGDALCDEMHEEARAALAGDAETGSGGQS